MRHHRLATMVGEVVGGRPGSEYLPYCWENGSAQEQKKDPHNYLIYTLFCT